MKKLKIEFTDKEYKRLRKIKSDDYIYSGSHSSWYEFIKKIAVFYKKNKLKK